ncbi:MAG: DUF4434 domain-containing protein [Armatimonadota bacterium]
MDEPGLRAPCGLARRQAVCVRTGLVPLAHLALTVMTALTAQGQENLAMEGTARSWLENSGATVPPGVVNDADLTTWWGSNEPSTDPPKDIGIAWDTPRTVGCVRVLFYSTGYMPAEDGWRLEARSEGEWQQLDATVASTESSRWTFRFPPATAEAVRLVTTAYAAGRVAVAEFEVYERQPPTQDVRRPPLLDGAFWAFQYAHWAERWGDGALAAEVDRAHAVGLDTIMLYTVMGRDGQLSTVMPGAPLPQLECWAGRDPLEVIMSRADELGMRVYIGDTQPTGHCRPGADPDEVAASTARLNAYRRALLERYGEHASLVGYYLNFELCPADFDNDPAEPARQVQQLAALISELRPDLEIVLPLGLYRWRDVPDATWHRVRPEELRRFWGPFVEMIPDVDAIMVIDGVGTGLAPLPLSDAAQATVRELCDQAGKAMWTDVECAVMGRGKGYYSFPIGRLVPSIEVAAKHADHIVTFDYPNYLSPANGREQSRRLYQDYRIYRNTLLGRW